MTKNIIVSILKAFGMLTSLGVFFAVVTVLGLSTTLLPPELEGLIPLGQVLAFALLVLAVHKLID